jgi:hypothetical protein
MSYTIAPSSASIIEFNPQPSLNGFVKLQRTLLRSTAWQAADAIERALYIDIADRYNGRNNGQISYSEYDGAKALRLHKRTIRRALYRLKKAGLLVRTKRGHFNIKTGHSTTSEWYLPDLDDCHNRTPVSPCGFPQPDTTAPAQPDTTIPLVVEEGRINKKVSLISKRESSNKSNRESSKGNPRGPSGPEGSKEGQPSNSNSAAALKNPLPPVSARPPPLPIWNGIPHELWSFHRGRGNG